MTKPDTKERIALRIYQALVIAGHVFPGGELRSRKVQATILDVLRDHAGGAV